MKKKLIFLPVLGLLLSGCSIEDLMFWKKKDEEPQEVLPTSLEVTPKTLDLKVSETKNLNELLSFTFEPSNVKDKSVTYSTTSPYFSVSNSTITTFEYEGSGTLRASSTKNSSVYTDITVNVSKDEPIVVTKYNVTYTSSEDFTVNGLKVDGYEANETVTFTIQVNNQNKEIHSVKVDTVTLEPTNETYSFSMPNHNVSLEVTLKNKDVPPVDTSTKYNIVYDMGTRKTSYAFKDDEADLIKACFVTHKEATDIISSVSSFEYIYGGGYGGSGDTAWLTGDILKFGTTSVNSSLSLTLSKEVDKVVITGMVSATSLAIRVNEMECDCGEMALAGKTTVDENAFTSLEVDINASNTLTISTTNKKVLYIKAIELFYSDNTPVVAKTYTVTWKNYDGGTLKVEEVNEGTTPKYEGAIPSKPSDDIYNYVFAGWDPVPGPINENTTYTALFNATNKDAKIEGSEVKVSSDYKTVEYGIYPQSHVSDDTLVPLLDSIPLDSNGYVLYNNEYYAKVTSNVYNNESYVFDDGVTIKNESPYWFKCETIKWDVLNISDNVYTLMSDLLLDSCCYYMDYNNRSINEEVVLPNNYKESDLRHYLNNEFLQKAFMLGDSALTLSDVDSLEDKVYVPSKEDINNLETKTAKTTDYSRATGAFASKDNTYKGNGSYWTRTPSENFSYAAYNVNAGGVLSEYAVDGASHSIRPCIIIELN